MYKFKDLVEFALLALGVIALAGLSALLEATPMGPLMIVWTFIGLLLWGVWGFLVYKGRKQETTEPILWISDGDHWVAMDGSGRKLPLVRRRTQTIFDQDEDAIKHLDFDRDTEKSN